MKKLISTIFVFSLLLFIGTPFFSCKNGTGDKEQPSQNPEIEIVPTDDYETVFESCSESEPSISSIFYDDNYFYFSFKIGGVKNVDVEPDGGFYFKYDGKGNFSYTYTTENVTVKSISAQTSAIHERLKYKDHLKSESTGGGAGLFIGSPVPFLSGYAGLSVKASTSKEYYRNNNTTTSTDASSESSSETISESKTIKISFEPKMPAGYYKVCQAVNYDAFIVLKVPFTGTSENPVFEQDNEKWNYEYLPLPRKGIATAICYSKTPFKVLSETDIDVTKDDNVFQYIADKIKTKSYDPTVVKEVNGRIGSGTVEDPFLVFTVEDFQKIEDAYSASYILMNDIDMKDAEWTPLKEFKGSLLGNGYAIKNFSRWVELNPTSSLEDVRTEKNVALFCEKLGKNATVKNLTLDGAYLGCKFTTNKMPVIDDDSLRTHKFHVGLFAGRMEEASIKNITIKNSTLTVVSSNYNNQVSVGGFSGVANNSSAENIKIISSNIESSCRAYYITAEDFGCGPLDDIRDFYDTRDGVSSNYVGGFFGFWGGTNTKIKYPFVNEDVVISASLSRIGGDLTDRFELDGGYCCAGIVGSIDESEIKNIEYWYVPSSFEKNDNQKQLYGTRAE